MPRVICSVDSEPHSELFFKDPSNNIIVCGWHRVKIDMHEDTFESINWIMVCSYCGEDVGRVAIGITEARNRPCNHLAYYLN